MGKYIISFKSVVEFFSSIKNYEQLTIPKREKVWKMAENIVAKCNNMGTCITREEFTYCKIKKLTKQRFETWRIINQKILERFKGTEYESVIMSKFIKKKSYLETSRDTYCSISNYYHKVEKIYHYIFMIAYHDDLIEIE